MFLKGGYSLDLMTMAVTLPAEMDFSAVETVVQTVINNVVPIMISVVAAWVGVRYIKKGIRTLG